MCERLIKMQESDRVLTRLRFRQSAKCSDVPQFRLGTDSDLEFVGGTYEIAFQVICESQVGMSSKVLRGELQDLLVFRDSKGWMLIVQVLGSALLQTGNVRRGRGSGGLGQPPRPGSHKSCKEVAHDPFHLQVSRKHSRSHLRFSPP